MKQLNFPLIKLWEERARKIKFVNEEGFRKEKLLRQLGISDHPLANSFGIVDYNELKRRNALFGFLLRNRDFRKYLRSAYFNFQLPSDGKSFLSYYFNLDDKKSMPFYAWLSSFKNQLNKSKEHTPETTKIRDFLNGSLESMKEEEFQKASEIKSLVDKATFVEGEVTVRLSFSSKFVEVSEGAAYGYKKHYYGAGKGLLMEVPEWTELKFFKFIFLHKLFEKIVDFKNAQRMKIFYSDYIVDSLSRNILEDVKGYFGNLREKGFLKNVPGGFGEGLRCRYFIRYRGEGLYLKLIDFDLFGFSIPHTEVKKVSFESSQLNFLGYSKKTIEELKKLNDKFWTRLDERQRNSAKYSLCAAFLKEFPGLEIEMDIPSPITDENYKWYGLEDLYNSPYTKSVFDVARKYRHFFADVLSGLKNVSSLVDILEEKSKKWRLSLSMPEILEPTKHLLSFEKLYPVQIIGDNTTAKKNIRVRDLKPIHSLEKINGQLIGLTGQNAGGKSVTHETIINALYLAQSGLPVFGKDFVCNPKNLIGMLFLERGEGSTMQLQIQKMVNIFKALKKYKGNSIFLVLDEIGTGTDYLEAVAYGTALLKKISQNKISCIYTTQFSDIAISAEKELGAKNYQLDTKHNIRLGVGKANLSYVINREGLSKYL